MTLSEIRNQILGHFVTNDHFSIEDDAGKITLPDSLVPSRDEIIALALSDLEKIDVVAKIGQDKWILRTPLISIRQNIQISGQTAELIADFINTYRDANGIKGDVCNKLDINERDLLNFLQIAHSLLNGETDDEE